MDSFNRFDIVEAYHLYARDYHTGQGSIEYQWLSRISLMGFKPSATLCYDSLTDNGKAIYDRLLEE